MNERENTPQNEQERQEKAPRLVIEELEERIAPTEFTGWPSFRQAGWGC